MNIVLLSGGSGKRLWPLSNDIRSKQFIRLFKDEAGNYESMVQRVYRQITTVDPDANVTIATSKSQVSAIRNQLGDRVSVCVEPCRRDTFPTIILAAAYLHDELGCSENEVVAICPVDHFVDDSYYEGVKQLEPLVQAGKANLALMGIAPDHPSSKYGYIIPETNDPVSMVREFREKPTEANAKTYIDQGALWNAGVFACTIGYLLEKARSMFRFTDYRDLFNKYQDLKKISFDYAVVEKEPSIQVMRYEGAWKDVGTWNMLADVMSDATKGNVILDDTCSNTHVVSELDLPIICIGCEDLVVAVSSDGILVSNKECSEAMKPYVEKLADTARYAEKSWGTFTVIDVQPNSMTAKVTLNAGSKMSYHSHELRNEVWTVISGLGTSLVDGMEQTLHPGDVISIAAGCKHTLSAITDMRIIEVQVGTEISANDKIEYPAEL